jgi:hypothetical protein
LGRHFDISAFWHSFALMLLNSLYFRFRPLIPRTIRLGIRRTLALRKLDRVCGTWPILPGSEQPPAGWPGWPEGKKFGLILTHDVESEVGVARVRHVAELEMKYGFRSSFNFIPEGPYSVPPALRSWLADRGFEVGVHDLQHDGNLYSSREEFRRKAQRINFHLKEWNAAGFRSGFMLHNLDWIGDLEIQYDSSTFDTDPFEPQPDGVNTIFPFWVPRSSAAGSLNHPGDGYIELPYTLPQDSTLFLLLSETTSRIWKAKLNWIAKHGGMVLLNTHPDYMRFYRHGSLHEFPAGLYEDFLKYLSTRYAGEHWHALPREVATFAFQYRNTAREEISGPGSVGTTVAPGQSGEFRAIPR